LFAFSNRINELRVPNAEPELKLGDGFALWGLPAAGATRSPVAVAAAPSSRLRMLGPGIKKSANRFAGDSLAHPALWESGGASGKHDRRSAIDWLQTLEFGA